jgi:hypothetical protein
MTTNIATNAKLSLLMAIGITQKEIKGDDHG